MLAQDMLVGLCTLLLVGLTITTGEETKSHLVNIEDVFYWRCPDLSGRQHRRGATLEEGCHRCTSLPLKESTSTYTFVSTIVNYKKRISQMC